jgi:hypothetical protein
MRQSRKEQSQQRTAKRLLLADRKEAGLLAELETEMEAAAEWGGRPRHIK